MTTKEVDNGPADESHPAWVKAYELAKAGKFTAALKLERSSLVNVQRASSGFTLLHQAAWHGASVAAEKLILLGARRDATDKEGKTAAAVARAQRHEKTAKRIESAGWWLVYEPAVGFLPSEQDGGFCRLAALTDKGGDWADKAPPFRIYSRGYVERVSEPSEEATDKWEAARSAATHGQQLPRPLVSMFLRRLDDARLIHLPYAELSVRGGDIVGGCFLRPARTRRQRQHALRCTLVDGGLLEVDDVPPPAVEEEDEEDEEDDEDEEDEDDADGGGDAGSPVPPSDGAALSTKVATASGALVTTVATGPFASAAPPAEP